MFVNKYINNKIYQVTPENKTKLPTVTAKTFNSNKKQRIENNLHITSSRKEHISKLVKTNSHYPVIIEFQQVDQRLQLSTLIIKSATIEIAFQRCVKMLSLLLVS